ncbi:hypothetical protein BH24ACT3_BH24ACT3_05240 [soil metagenome]
MTVQQLADELGLHVLRVLEVCRSSGVRAASARDQLSPTEADRVRAVVAGAAPPPPPTYAPPPPSFPPPSPPTYAQPAPACGSPPPHGAPAPGWGGPPPPYAVSRTSGNATGAFVCGILALCTPLPLVLGIVGLVLAHQGGKEIKASGGRLDGAGFVTAARVLSIISLVLWALWGVFFVLTLATSDG